MRDMDLTTTYSGLRLPHPLVCGASPLSADLDMILRLEDAGAAAVVMHSLFEEQILKDAMRRPHLGRDSRTRVPGHASLPLNAYAMAPGEYLEHLLRVKARVGIPIIASLNGTTPDGWLQYARALERAGADALELNFYHVATDPSESGTSIEQRLIDIVAVVKESVTIPVAIKLSPFYSSVPNLAMRLERIGADGLVLFNRFYQADIDPETRGTTVQRSAFRFGGPAAPAPRDRHSFESCSDVAGLERRRARADRCRKSGHGRRRRGAAHLHPPSTRPVTPHLPASAVREVGERAPLRLARSVQRGRRTCGSARPTRLRTGGLSVGSAVVERRPSTAGRLTPAPQQGRARLDLRTCSIGARSA